MKSETLQLIKEEAVNLLILLALVMVIMVLFPLALFVDDLGILGRWKGLMWLAYLAFDISACSSAGAVLIFREERLAGRLRPLSVYIRAFRLWYMFHQKMKRA